MLHRVFLADTDQDNICTLVRLFRELYGVSPQIWQDMQSYRNFLRGPEEGVVLIRIDNQDISGLSLTGEALPCEPRIQIAWMACSEAHGVEAFSYGADAYLLLPASEGRISEVMKTLTHKRKNSSIRMQQSNEEEI